VQITNVPKVKLIISKIYENNLLMGAAVWLFTRRNQKPGTPVMKTKKNMKAI
jgi:hypothetical protein